MQNSTATMSASGDHSHQPVLSFLRNEVLESFSQGHYKSKISVVQVERDETLGLFSAITPSSSPLENPRNYIPVRHLGDRLTTGIVGRPYMTQSRETSARLSALSQHLNPTMEHQRFCKCSVRARSGQVNPYADQGTANPALLYVPPASRKQRRSPSS